MNRFSKIVSEMRDEPSAIHIIAMNCACKSVGKPGNGSVVISAATGRPFATIRIVSSVSVIVAPVSRSTISNASSVRALVRCNVKSPPVIAAAMAKVPASIRSEITACVAPCNSSTPSTEMVPVPCPVILAPIAFRQLARSIISGSRATFTNSLGPLARAAAISAFSVAPTDTIGNTTRPPLKPPGARA